MGASGNDCRSFIVQIRGRPKQWRHGTRKEATMTTLTTESPVNQPSGSRFGRTPWMIAGGVALAAAGVGAGLAWRPAPTNETAAPVTASMTSAESTVAAGRSTEQMDADKTAENKVAAAKPVPAKPKAPVHKVTPAATTHASNDTTPLATQHAQVCATCGVIEGVRAVEQKGKGTGIGAVGGGVVGAAVGNQFGHGNGKAAMTVLGALGGGLAGNEIEKRARSETVYEVRVRMDDGSVRTLTQKTAPTPGARVTVDGNTLHTTRAPQSGQMGRTSAGAASP